MAIKEDVSDREAALDVEAKTTEQQIANFAAKLGEETGGKYQVYIYRIEKDEETGKQKKPFVKKYVGIEPDPAEIAERFRGGSYLCQFIWYVKGEQKSRGWVIDIDPEAFPPLPKDRSLVSLPVNSNLSETMQLQLATISAITEVMKAAYSQGNNGAGRGAAPAQDPLDMFSGMMATMENSYRKAMQIQSTVLERVYMRSLESQYGIQEGGAAPAAEEPGMIGQYGGIIKEIIDGLKYVVGLFGGNIPPQVVEKVKRDERFKEFLKDEKFLVVIGSALRREFGDKKAAEYMEKFGVKMIVKRPAIAATPEIPGLKSPAGGRGGPAQAAPAAQAAPGGSRPGSGPRRAVGGEKGRG